MVLLPRLQQVLELLGVLDRIVRVVVVHERVHLLARTFHLLDPRDPLQELLVLVVVAEAQVRRSALEVPGLVVAAVKTHDRELRRGDLVDGRHARLVALGHVDGDIGDVARPQERNRAVEVPGVEPFRLAKFDCHLEAEHALLALLDVRQRAGRRQEPRRELEKDRAQLAGDPQGFERRAKPFPGLIEQLVGHLLEVDVLFTQILGQLVPDFLGQRHRLGRMVGEQREGLDIESEALRRASQPELRGLGLGHALVRRIDLAQGELAGVKVQPLLRGRDVEGIEELGVDERLVDPAGNPHPHGHGPIVAQGRYDPCLYVGRYIRYWYTYRTAVAVVLAVVLSGAIYSLYTQQVTCDTHVGTCIANLSVHPDDRFVPRDNPDPNIVIVGIDDQSLKDIGRYPVPRDVYARVLQTLAKDCASEVAFDIGFPDQRDPLTDGVFAKALATSTIPVVLGYAGDNLVPGDGKMVQCSGNPGSPCPGVDEIPLRMFRCADASSDPNASCSQPYPNVILASTDVQPDTDVALRRIPLFVQPACAASGACSYSIINTLGFAAYRAWLTQGVNGPQLQESNGQATFGTTWKEPLQAASTGAALINYFVPPRNYQAKQYVSFGDLYSGRVSPDKIKGNLILIGAYYLTSYNDSVLATTSAGGGSGTGAPMAGVEMHANVAQMFTPNVTAYPKFLAPEPPLVVFLVILALCLLMAPPVTRVSVLWGLLATSVALVVFTIGMAVCADHLGIY